MLGFLCWCSIWLHSLSYESHTKLIIKLSSFSKHFLLESYNHISTCRFLPPLPAPPCRLVPPCPSAAPQLAVVLQGIRCVCGCRPSCRFICCGFWKPPRVGEVLPKFRFDTILFLLLQERLLQRPRLVTLQDSKVRHKRPFFPYHVCISRNLARRLPFERDTVGNMQIFAYL